MTGTSELLSLDDVAVRASKILDEVQQALIDKRLWHFVDEGADQGESIDKVRQTRGFCQEDIEMPRRVEIRKYRDEPKGAQGDSWCRDIAMTAGWPASGESTAEPETRR